MVWKYPVKIFVEGEADKKLINDFLEAIFEITTGIVIIPIGGKSKLDKTTQEFEKTTDDKGVNLIIFDADDDFKKSSSDLLKKKKELSIDFQLFLFPNNQDNGTLENLLINIINPKHQQILDCFDSYTDCLKKRTNEDLNIPTLKSKVYAYLETLYPKSKQDLIKDSKREYKNTEIWNLECEYITPLKDFLSNHIH
ncbi:MAG: hypothetical protein KBG21_04320 [Ignavibacteria bacterium]|nr:hypothetical protein [Ignavibacteria bacterium]